MMYFMELARIGFGMQRVQRAFQRGRTAWGPRRRGGASRGGRRAGARAPRSAPPTRQHSNAGQILESTRQAFSSIFSTLHPWISEVTRGTFHVSIIPDRIGPGCGAVTECEKRKNISERAKMDCVGKNLRSRKCHRGGTASRAIGVTRTEERPQLTEDSCASARGPGIPSPGSR